MTDQDTCRRVASIWSKSDVVVVQCVLEILGHPDDWHRDPIHGTWEEVEELDERYDKE